MKCSLCLCTLQDNLPYVPYVVWKGKPVGECCYDKLLDSLKIESLTGDTSMLYDFEGFFTDDDHKKYHISQSVSAGPGNMGFSRVLTIKNL